MHCSPTNNNNNNTKPFSLSLQKRNTTSTECERGKFVFRILCARFRENVRSLKDLKIFFFPLLRVKGAEAQKIHLGSQSFFFGLCPKIFGLPLPLLKKVCQNFGKKKQKEDMRRALWISFCLCCVVLARRGETFIIKGFGERKGAELFLLLTRFIKRTIYLLRFKADIPLLFFLLFLGNDDYDDDGVDESASFSLSSFTRLLCWSRGDSTDDDGKDAVITTQKQV